MRYLLGQSADSDQRTVEMYSDREIGKKKVGSFCLGAKYKRIHADLIGNCKSTRLVYPPNTYPLYYFVPS